MATINTTTLLLILLVSWVLYSLLQSYNNIVKELREIRVKCVLPNNNSTSNGPANNYNVVNYPMKNISSTLVSGLSQFL